MLQLSLRFGLRVLVRESLGLVIGLVVRVSIRLGLG